MILNVISSGSAGNCYVLRASDGSALVLECGAKPEAVLRRVQDVQPSKVVCCLVSHEHGDHAAYAGRWAALGIPLIMSKGTAEALNCTGDPRIRIARDMMLQRIGKWTVSSFKLVHDAAEPLGFIIEHPECGKVLFVTDTAYCTYNFRSMRLNHILVEANYSDDILDERVERGDLPIAQAARVRRTHMSIKSACELIKANETADLQTVILIHLSSGNGDAGGFARIVRETALFAKIYVAAAGLAIELNKTEI